MKKTFLLYNIIFFLILSAVSACNKSEHNEEEGGTYLVSGCVVCDSTMALDSLMLYVDNHNSLRIDTIVLDDTLRFTRQYHTKGLDELVLCCDSGELCRFYATEGMMVDFLLDVSKDEVRAKFEASENDTINAWLQQMSKNFDSWSEFQRKDKLDALIADKDTTMRTTLLLRDHVMEFNDSVYVRRFLGGQAVSAKPKWLIQSIEHLLDEKSLTKNRSRRLPAATFEMKDDSVLFNMADSRSDYLLIYFWADYSEESVDSLKVLAKLIADKYEDKRLNFMTCCLHTPDSAWWAQQVLKQPGKHTWVKGGMSDPRLKDWGIRQTPSVVLLDMYNNQQQRDVWGETLRKALDRLPKRILGKR